MFESSVIVSRHQKRDRRKMLILPVSIALHVAAISAGVFAAVWSVEMPTGTPNQLQTYVVQPKVVPPPPAQLGRKKQPDKKALPDPPKVEPAAPLVELVPVEVPEDVPDAGFGTEEGIGDEMG